MLQAGVATKDMDPRWMSSISWYFLCFFGLQSVFNFLLGDNNGTPPPDSLRDVFADKSQPQARWRSRWDRWARKLVKCLVRV
jgi:ER membrane protein complex subunit 3